ncbi:hypothetical protein [Escherichia coli]|uniref:hypothetical protein n=1 Tax=Escherichia coli TaxID=562 RepID=UPI0026993D9A
MPSRHGAQGASETFAIALEGTEGNRKLMAGFESAYVALSRMKQHVQVYTDNRQGWTDAINNAVRKELPTMCWSRNGPGGHECAAAVQYGTGTAGRGGGRAVLRRRAAGGTARTVYCTGRKYPHRMWHCRRLTVTASRWYLAEPLTTDDGNGLRGFSGEGRVKGSGDAQLWPAGQP